MFLTVLNLRGKEDYPHGLSQDTIMNVSDYCKNHFNCDLPKDYAQFLSEANGFSYDGRSVFCCFNDEIRKEFPRYSGLDFVSFNVRFHENTDINDYLVIGKSSIDYICYEKSTCKYITLTNGTMQVVSESTDLRSLLESFFAI